MTTFKKYLSLFIIILLCTQHAEAQDNIYPVPAHKGSFLITHAVIHIGNGQIINDGTIKITNGKIESVGASTATAAASGINVIDAGGKHVYPGLISSITNLGLREVTSGVRGANDFAEIGDINPSVRAIVAYNTDSKVIGTLRSNGILLANIIPQDEEEGSSSLLTGSSSVVQLDAWTWKDAAYKTDGQFHLNMPSLIVRPSFFAPAPGQAPQPDPVKAALEKIDRIKAFFKQGKAYAANAMHDQNNLKYASLKELYTKKQKLFVHCNTVREMLLAMDFVTEFGFDIVIVGGSESWQIAPLLKQNNIQVILQQLHSLPRTVEDNVDRPFTTPAVLQKAGVLFALSDNDGTTRGRNLMFNAGTAVAYGLTKEEALSAITLNAAKILGIADRTGSVEAGKDANIIISDGDILDMKSSVISHAFIQGRMIDLQNKQTQLYDRYKYKYGLK